MANRMGAKLNPRHRRSKIGSGDVLHFLAIRLAIHRKQSTGAFFAPLWRAYHRCHFLHDPYLVADDVFHWTKTTGGGFAFAFHVTDFSQSDAGTIITFEAFSRTVATTLVK